MSYLKINKHGDKYWYNDNGEKHREGKPAVEFADGLKWWCINGKFHREDGPAVEWCNGSKAWYHNDNRIGMSWHGYTQEDFERYLRELKIKEYW